MQSYAGQKLLEILLAKVIYHLNLLVPSGTGSCSLPCRTRDAPISFPQLGSQLQEIPGFCTCKAGQEGFRIRGSPAPLTLAWPRYSMHFDIASAEFLLLGCTTCRHRSNAQVTDISSQRSSALLQMLTVSRPAVINQGKGKPPILGCFNYKIMYKWGKVSNANEQNGLQVA